MHVCVVVVMHDVVHVVRTYVFIISNNTPYSSFFMNGYVRRRNKIK